MDLIITDKAYWVRLPASSNHTFYDVLWVDDITQSMTDKYPTLHVTTHNGDRESYYYKGRVPQEEIPPDLYDDIVLDLEPLNYRANCPAIDPAALNDFLS